MKKNIVSLLMSCFMVSPIFAQTTQSNPTDIQNIFPPTSPTAAALSRYIDFPVNLSNGIPNVDIPLYEFKSSRITVPISVSYHAGGIKVTDRASTMGLGWTLNAGGAITRMVNGVPDDDATYGYLNTAYPNLNGSNNFSITGFGAGNYPSDNDYNQAYCFVNQVNNAQINNNHNNDAGPDTWFYNFQNLGGKFMFRPNGQVVTMPYAPVQINFNRTDAPDVSAPLTVINEDGTIYQFGQDLRTNIPQPYDRMSNAVDYTASNGGVNTPVANAWYLTRIISADHSDTVTFNYAPVKETNNLLSTSTSIHRPYSVYGLGGITTAEAPIITNTYARTLEYNARLISITGKNSMIQFNYGSDVVSYQAQTGIGIQTSTLSISPLQSIAVYAKLAGSNTLIKTFNFSHSHFQSDGGFPKAPNTLRLDSIQESDGNGHLNPPYSFTYDTSDVPPYNTIRRDLWGYFNAYGSSDLAGSGTIGSSDVNQNMLLVDVGPADPATGILSIVNNFAKRAGSPGDMSKGMLQRILYPTRGYTTFNFEPNQLQDTTYVNVNQNGTTQESCHIVTPDQISVQGSDNTFTPMQGASVTRTLTFSGSIVCTTGCINNNPEVILQDVTTGATLLDQTLQLVQNPSTGVISLQAYTQAIININPAHQCRLYLANQNNPGNSSLVHYSLNAMLVETTPPGPPMQQRQVNTVYGGGMRVTQITHNDAKGNTITKKYNYIKPYFNSNIFQGDFTFLSAAMDRILYGGLNSTITSNHTSNPPLGAYAFYQISSDNYYESPSYSVGGLNGSISYQHVAEIEGDMGQQLGETQYIYNTGLDEVPNWVLSVKTDQSFVRSQLLYKKIYKTSGNTLALIAETQNTYNNINNLSYSSSGSDYIKMYQTACLFDNVEFAKLQASQTPPVQNEYASSPGFAPYEAPGCSLYWMGMPVSFNIIYQNIVRPVLTSSKLKVISTAKGDSTITRTNYFYNNLKHLKPTKIITINSNGRQKTTLIKYPTDLDTVNTNTLRNPLLGVDNLRRANIITPLEETVYLGNPNQNDSTLVSSIFSFYNPTLPVKDSVTTAEFITPVSNFQPAFIVNTPSQGFTQNTYNLDRHYVKKVNYSYSAQGDIVVQQKVSGPHEAYQWGYNHQYQVASVKNATANDIFYDSFEEGNGNSSSGDAKTGHYSHTGSYTKTLTGVDVGNYNLSYWTESSPGTWVLQTTQVTANSSTFIINLSGQIDDVRFYPEGALMDTYTYDPNVGMTSATDPKNEISYYQYDGFQRLINVKDKDGNIIKHTDYHYANQ